MAILIIGFGSQSANARALTIKSISDIKVTINQGTKYSLPKAVTAVMSNNSKKSVAVRWNVKSISTSKISVFSYYGTVSGYMRKIRLVSLGLNMKIVPGSLRKQTNKN